MLASGLAGSLHGALENNDPRRDVSEVKEIPSALFLPPPTMALMIGSTLRNEWSDTDLLSDRLQIMIPLLPGMTVPLSSHPSDIAQSPHASVSVAALRSLSELLTSA